MAIIDVVKWDAAPGVIAWKYPSMELSTWTQLIVSESQEALLLKEGKAIGPFSAGRHILATENFPLLSSLYKIPFGRSPFTAEVWFVQKSYNLNIKWGTSASMQLEDPRYHVMLPVRAFGQYGITISDTNRFLIKLVGTLPAFTEKTLIEYFKGIVNRCVKDLIAKYLVEKNISILHISAHLNDISEAVQSSLKNNLDTYGVTIFNFNINSITTDENDGAVKKLKDALATRAEMEIVGFNYQQKRSFDTMETAAGNASTGNIMGAPIGLGMGVGMGVPMGNMIGGMTQNLQTSSTVRCPNCHKENSPEATYCLSCGKLLRENETHKEMIECVTCKTLSPKGSKFCSNCGDIFNCCPECGANNPQEELICKKCGAKLPIECPTCKAKLNANLKFCPLCGLKLIKTCSSCGVELPKDVKFCPNCGLKTEGN